MIESQPTKRIRLTIEWRGACSELDWIDRLVEAFEEFDTSGQSRVVMAERLTCHGTTEVIGKPKRRRWWHRRPRALRIGVPPNPIPPPPPRPK